MSLPIATDGEIGDDGCPAGDVGDELPTPFVVGEFLVGLASPSAASEGDGVSLWTGADGDDGADGGDGNDGADIEGGATGEREGTFDPGPVVEPPFVVDVGVDTGEAGPVPADELLFVGNATGETTVGAEAFVAGVATGAEVEFIVSVEFGNESSVLLALIVGSTDGAVLGAKAAPGMVQVAGQSGSIA